MFENFCYVVVRIVVSMKLYMNEDCFFILSLCFVFGKVWYFMVFIYNGFCVIKIVGKWFCSYFWCLGC